MGRNTAYLEAAREIIPWGTQTNAKRHHAEMGEAMPAFIERANGCRMWDLEGREYIDYRCALGPIILGYRFPAVDEAVRIQMSKGTLFSMASPVELEVAKEIVELVPCAEMVRFMKTGADANMCNVRIARAYTGRDHIIICGYHGYHDYFMVTQQGNGVPQAVRDLVTPIGYGDFEKLRETFRTRGETIAAMVMEPFNAKDPAGEFTKEARKLTSEYGALLIFDEIITGFRLAKGGAQEYLGITPDLASLGKAVANGYPLSVYCGKRQFMSKLDDFVLTTTYAGDTLSLAAARATLAVMQNEPVHKHLYRVGERLQKGIGEVAGKVGVEMAITGNPVQPGFAIVDGDKEKESALNTEWRRQLFAHGVFPHWFVNYSHQPSDIDETIDKAEKALRATLKRG